MPNESSTIVQRLWNYCNVLRDDGVSYGDYVEQLTYLLFLKMADEQTKPPFNKPSTIPKELDWQSLLEKDGDSLEVHYRHILESLGKKKGMLGLLAVHEYISKNYRLDKIKQAIEFPSTCKNNHKD
ncbi:hypothetical protein TISLANDTSLP1_06390 [Thermodesulfovibrio yellowstonii]|uniref:N6 adenine-specific DNA methyltransferase N-terminal domain-containing protein n=1 Tax=Thermodesulfovibrio yellowstonii TaxID=28262 RepID=A0A9W6GFI2_9BACT|nr:type I restriction-modification system subunit M N-terminal domain-containing protein [Thermodesulfovibrio islandicus]GLI52946.1 hypothetical protein TISLANDTSLP1_06390 [Thermodesulfovibrio islandicus]